TWAVVGSSVGLTMPIMISACARASSFSRSGCATCMRATSVFKVWRKVGVLIQFLLWRHRKRSCHRRGVPRPVLTPPGESSHRECVLPRHTRPRGSRCIQSSHLHSSSRSCRGPPLLQGEGNAGIVQDHEDVFVHVKDRNLIGNLLGDLGSRCTAKSPGI